MKRILFSFIVLFLAMLFYSCSSKQKDVKVADIKKEAEIVSDSSSFQKYSAKLKLYDTPFELSHGLPANNVHYDIAPF